VDDTNTSKVEKPATPDNKKRSKNKIFYAVVGALLVGVFAAVGWFYYDSTQTVREQKALISNLQERLRDLGVEIPVPEGGGGGEDSAACEGGSTYSADIGKFAVTLSSPRVVVRNLDAGFEGGPITDLTIGKCLADETNVVDAYLLSKVNILGHPAADSATLRANFEAQWGSPLTLGAPVTIDGVAAQTYTGDGLFATKLVYFDHAGIGYQIELPDANPTSEATLTDVIADWSFTP
jgi:hypothetical protein